MPTSCPLPTPHSATLTTIIESARTLRCDAPDDDELARRAAARVGATLAGKFRLDALLGVGGFGAVYAVTTLLKLRAPAASSDTSETLSTFDACAGKLVVKMSRDAVSDRARDGQTDSPLCPSAEA